jgi:hypothetical protein
VPTLINVTGICHVESWHGWLDEMAFERTQHTRVALSPHAVGFYSHLGSMLSHDTCVYDKAILRYSCVLRPPVWEDKWGLWISGGHKRPAVRRERLSLASLRVGADLRSRTLELLCDLPAFPVTLSYRTMPVSLLRAPSRSCSSLRRL